LKCGQTFVLVCLLAGGSVSADNGRNDPANIYYRWVDVVDVQEVTYIETVSVPVEHCIDEHRQHVYGRPYRRHRSYEDDVYEKPPGGFRAILGGLIGGLIGHQFGGGNGKTALTVAGAVTGAAIADSMRRKRGRCRIDYEEQNVERVGEYEVTYLYQGREYVKRTHEHPGERVRIRLQVMPEVTSVSAGLSDNVQVSFRPRPLSLPTLRERNHHV
jgi:uncharacterized protein YcfJ